MAASTARPETAAHSAAVLSHHRPRLRANTTTASFRRVLPTADVLIGCRHHVVETLLFRHFQELAVFQLIRPAHFDDGMNYPPRKEATRTDRNGFIKQVFIKQDEQPGDSGRKSQSLRRAQHERAFRPVELLFLARHQRPPATIIPCFRRKRHSAACGLIHHSEDSVLSLEDSDAYVIPMASRAVRTQHFAAMSGIS
jgi:hypothetical protein